MAFIDNSGKVPLKYVFPAGWACDRGRKRSSFTLNVGTWARARIQIHTLSRKSDFLFLPDSATVFPPSHPLASYYLELFLEVYQHLGNFFACCQLQFCFHCDVDSSVNKYCCIVVWQTKCIQCVRTFVYTTPLRLRSQINPRWALREMSDCQRST